MLRDSWGAKGVWGRGINHELQFTMSCCLALSRSTSLNERSYNR